MDSLTQVVLGGAVAAAVAPAAHRRAALLAGAALGTLPDLDSLPLALLTDDPVALMTLHRGASHSLLVLPLVGWLAWAWLRGRGGRVAQAPRRWFWAIQLALVTHPLLDAFTVYGTQLLWPLPLHPVMWASVFIIDPLYTLWLLLACVAAFVLRERVAALDALRGAPAVERLAWFNRGFMRAREVGGELVLSDLRMGHEPDYVFNFAVARRGAGWEPIPPRQVRLPRNAGPVWAATWRRMWGRDQAAADSGGATPADSASK